MNLTGAFDERLDESVANMVEHRAQDFFEEAVGKRVMQFEFHLTGGLPQRSEAPAAIEAGKRALREANQHLGGITLGVLGAEVGLDAVVVDVQRGGGDFVGAAKQLDVTAPL